MHLIVQEALIAAGVGNIAGRIVVHRIDQRKGEMTPQRVRELELKWTCAAAIGGAFAGVFLR